jgi:hypothetical protein
MKERLSAKQLIFWGLLSLGVFTGHYLAQAATWTGPTATPPAGNKDEPINVGTTGQEKNGFLLLSNTTGANNFSIRDTGQNNILNFRINSSGSNAIRDWVMPNTLGSTGQALVVSGVSGNTMNLSWSSAGMPAGSAAGATWYWDGSAWQNSANLFNNNGNIGIGVSSPADFKLQIDGHTGPNTDNTFNLGSASKRWANLYATNINFTGNFNPGFTAGSLYFQGATGVAQDNANLFWDDAANNLGIGTASPNSRIHVYQSSGANAEIDLQSTAAAGSHWGIYHDRTSDELRLWKDGANQVAFSDAGVMNLGTVPWARLPAVATCSGGTPVVTGFNASGPICGAANLAAGSGAGATLYYDGSAWQNSTNLFNNNGNIGIGVSSPADFKLQINGHTGPNTDNTFNLGSATRRWANLYATTINTTPGGLNLGIPNSALVFGSPSGTLDYDSTFVYDKATSRLTIGNSNNSAAAIISRGNIYPNTNNTFDLGSASLQWRNIFTNNLTLSGFTAGSVIFQGASALAENNNNFFWDNTNSRLGIGTGHPLDNLQVQSSWYVFPNDICRIDISSSSVVVNENSGGYVCWFTHDLAVGTEVMNIATGEYRMVTKVNNNDQFEVDRPWSITSSNVSFSLRSRNLAVTETGHFSIGGGLMDTYTSAPIDGSGIFKLSGKLFLHNSGWNDWVNDVQLANSFWFSNTFLGENAGSSFAINDDQPYSQLNTAIGFEALKNLDPTSGWGANTAIGAQSMHNLSGVSQYNVALGARALQNGAGSNNVAIGFESLASGAASGGSNVAIGFNAGRTNAGQQNTYIGTSAGSTNSSGDGNIFIGYEAGKTAISGDNKFVISNTDDNQYESLLYGQFDPAAGTANAFLRLNGRLQFGFGANDYRAGLTNNAGNGLCINIGVNNNLQLFLINGAVICTRVVAAANCAGNDFAACCANQAGGCQ